MLIAVSILFLLSSSASGQEDISAVMESAVGAVSSFAEDPAGCDPEDIGIRISLVDSALGSAGKLSEYQVWTLKYIQAYLYYIRGLARGGSIDFETAADIFGDVGRSGGPGLNPAKKDFAAYMVAWCRIRSFEASGDAGGLQRTAEMLEQAGSKRMAVERRFLAGYARLAIGSASLNSAAVTEESYRAAAEAENIFAGIRFREETGKGAQFYHLYARWLKARMAKLYRYMKRRPGESIEPVPALEQLNDDDLDSEFAALREYAREVAAELKGTPAETEALYLGELALLQRAAGKVSGWVEENRERVASLDQSLLAERYNLFGAMALEELDPARKDIIIASRSLIANIPSGNGRSVSSEAELWSSIARVNAYVQRDKEKYFSGKHLLDNLPRGMFSGSYRAGAESGLDSLAAQRRDIWSAYCDLLSAERPSRRIQAGEGEEGMEILSEIIPAAAKAGSSGKRYPSESNLDFLISRSGIECSSDDCTSAGRLAIALANCIPRLSASQERKRRVLYTAAHMLFRIAEEKAGRRAAGPDVYLLQGFSLINSAPLGDTDGNGSPDNRDALEKVLNDILAPERIEGWPARYRNEARYYRAVMERQVRGRFFERTRKELRLIAGADPRAAYILGYEAVEGADQDMLSACGCLAEHSDCMQWLFPLLKKAGWEKSRSPEVCSGTSIGPPGVRYDMLRPGESECNYTRSLILDMLANSLDMWSACVSPPELVNPASGGNDNGLQGPEEFAYLQDDIRVDFRITGAPPADIRLTIMSGLNSPVYRGKLSGVKNLRSGKRYIFIFSARGFLPAVAERVFALSGETVEIEMGPAYLDYAGECSLERIDGGHPVFYGGGSYVKIGPAGVRYYLDGAERIGKPLPGAPVRSISEFAVSGGEIFAYDNNNREVINLSSGDERAVVLDLEGYGIDPSDIASDGEYLYIADEESSEISIYDPERKALTDRISTGINPALIAACRFDGRVMAAAWDNDRGLMVSDISMSDFVPASGMQAAAADGMEGPFRLSVIPERGLIFCRNNLFDRKLFIFLPTGGYAGSISIPDEIDTPCYFALYSGSSLRVGSPGGIATCRMEIDPDYDYILPGPVTDTVAKNSNLCSDTF